MGDIVQENRLSGGRSRETPGGGRRWLAEQALIAVGRALQIEVFDAELLSHRIEGVTGVAVAGYDYCPMVDCRLRVVPRAARTSDDALRAAALECGVFIVMH